MATFIRKIKAEFIDIIPAIIYFCIAFNLIFFLTGLGLPPGTKRYFSYLSMTIDGFIAGKIIIIMGMTPFMNAFPKKPLIYNIVWKFFIYAIAILVFWSIEAFIHLYFVFDNATLVYQKLLHEINSTLFIVTLSWILMVFFIFIVGHEFIQAIGKEKVKKMLLG